MELLPENLGVKWHIALVRNRAYGPSAAWKKPEPPRLGKLGRVWTKGLDLPDDVAATTLPMASDETLGYSYGLGIPFGLLGLAGAGVALGFHEWSFALLGMGVSGFAGWGSFLALPRFHLKKLHKTPVRPEEIETFVTQGVPGLPSPIGQWVNQFVRFWNQKQPEIPDALEQGFLSLAQECLRHETIPDAIQEDLRATLRSLGDAISALPPTSEQETGGTLEAMDLRGDAQILLARAERETDTVVAGSLRRQADALYERARSAEHAGRVNRRTRALRDELRAQIDALRAALPQFGKAAQTVNADTRNFARLAESVRGVAREAVAVADAHMELETESWAHREAALSELDGRAAPAVPPRYNTPPVIEPEQDIQRLGRG